MTVLIIADDLTGAADTVVQYVRHGAKSAIILRRPESILHRGYEALAFSTDSRALPKEGAYQSVYSLIHRLKIHPGDLIYKKIDSAIRGNIGAEIAALLDALPDCRAALVAPASPENQRITRDGYQYIHGIQAHLTEMAHDPLTPVCHSYLPFLLADQSKKQTGHITLAEVSSGVANTRRRLRELIYQGCQIVVADANTADNLDTLAQALEGEKGIIPCGAAGFGGAVARRMAAEHPKHKQRQFENPLRGKGYFLAVIGSKSRQSSMQVAHVKTNLPHIPIVTVNPGALSSDHVSPKEITRTITEIENQFTLAKTVILCLDQQTPARPVLPDPSRIVLGLGEIVSEIKKKVPLDVVFVTGGDTAFSLLGKFGAEVLEIEGELEPGVCQGWIGGGQAAGMRIITKAGSFGSDALLTNLMKAWPE